MAQYIRQHEKALANSLQLSVQRRKPPPSTSLPATTASPSANAYSSTSTLAAALSFAGLNFKSHAVKSAQLTLTPHHLFYLLSRIEELDVNVGPMNVRIESIHNDSAPANYISFLQTHKQGKGRSDADSIHSVSSVRSVMSGMSSLWSSIGLSNSSSKTEKAKLAFENDMKYIYAAFTKLPSLRLTPDHRTPLIKGFEQFPFDTAVPLFAFKNVQQLEIIDLDFRSFHGWDRLADQLCLLTIKRGNLDDPLDLLHNIVLDDAEKRRRRSNRTYGDAPSTPSWSMPSTPRQEYARSSSDPGSPQHASPGSSPLAQGQRDTSAIEGTPIKSKAGTQVLFDAGSPKRPAPTRPASSSRHIRTYSSKVRRSGSGSSNIGDSAGPMSRNDVTANQNQNTLPASKWQRLVYLSLADNGLSMLMDKSIAPLTGTLRSFNLSSNLFTEIPDSLSKLSRLVSLDLSNCMIDSLQTLVTHPLPAITTLKLRTNRLQSLAGIERLPSLENLNVQDNKLSDPDEAARLTQIPNLKRLWIRHNPLTKRYPDYRVRILNQFRKAPGHLEDIVLDDVPASYNERKQLVERVVEVERPLPPMPTLEEHVPDPPCAKAGSEMAPPPVPQLSSVDMSSPCPAHPSMRRRGTRRRIVDLSAKALPSEALNKPISVESVGTVDLADQIAYKEPKVLLEDRPRLVTASPELAEFHDEMAETLTNSPTGEDYRRNVEDLRLKFGNNWLGAFGEHTWQSESDLPSQADQVPRLIHHHTSPTILHVGGSML